MKLATLQAGQFVETGGYYTKGDAGQAKYLIVAAQAADGYGDHTLVNGTVAVLQLNGNPYNPQQFGARLNTDDSSYTEAMQAIVNISGNPASATNPNTAKIKVPKGTFYIKNPIYIDSLDGLEIEHAGLFTTTIKVSSSFSANAGTVPATFPSDGLDYTGSAYFVVARRRNTGKTNAFIDVGQAPTVGAGWYYKFGGFYIDAEGTNVEKSFDVIRAPEIANLWMQNIIGNKIRWILHTDDDLGCYSSTFDRLQTWYSVGGLKAKRGTSLVVNQCALVHSDEGWNTGTNYTTYNSTTIDLCGISNWAWDLTGTGVTMNSCGAEYPKGGIFRALSRGTVITINGGFFLGGAINTSPKADPNWAAQTNAASFGVSDLILIDEAKVLDNNATWRALVQPVQDGTITHLDAKVDNGGRWVRASNTGEDFSGYLQPHEINVVGDLNGVNDLSRLTVNGDKAEFKLVQNTNITIPKSTTTQIVFDNVTREFDLGPSWFETNRGMNPRSGTTVNQYVAPYSGVYTFRFDARTANAVTNDYLQWVVTGIAPNQKLDLNVDSAGLATCTSTNIFNLKAGDTVRLFFRSTGAVNDVTIYNGCRFMGKAE